MVRRFSVMEMWDEALAYLARLKCKGYRKAGYRLQTILDRSFEAAAPNQNRRSARRNTVVPDRRQPRSQSHRQSARQTALDRGLPQRHVPAIPYALDLLGAGRIETNATIVEAYRPA